MAAETKQVDAEDSEPEAELPEAEPKDESHEEKREPALIFGTYAKISHGPGHITGPANREAENEQAKRRIIVPIPTFTERDHGSIETDHEMEEVDLEVARYQPKLPTFPSESDLPAYHDDAWQSAPMPSNTGPVHPYDEMEARDTTVG